MRNSVICLLFLSAVAGLSCRQVQKKNNSEKSSGLVSELEGQLSRMDSSWNVMMASDNGKISNIQRLIKELSLIDGSRETVLRELEEETQRLTQSRYNRYSMKVSSEIDRYDSLTNAVISRLKQEITGNPNANRYQIVNQLVSEIQAADDSVLFFRKEFDRNVDLYNSFLKEHLKELKKLNPQYDSLRPSPVFRLIP